jgi:transposase
MPTCGRWHGCTRAAIPLPVPPLSIGRGSKRSWAGCAATTGTRRWWASNGTCWSIAKGACSVWECMRRASPSAKAATRCSRPRGTPLPACSIAGRIKATRARWCAGAGALGLVRWAEQEHGWRVQGVYPQFRQLARYAPEVLEKLGAAPGFRVIPRRWVVERTFSWVGRQRRMSKDDERLTSTEEVFISLVGIRLLLTRLPPA